jgi:V/A-type H+-transporting ATPase subunit F
MTDGGFLVIGEAEIVTGFRFAGVPGVVSLGRDDTLEAFRRSCAEGRQVVILTQDVAGLIRDELIAWQMGARCPLVVELPPLAGPVEGHKSLVELIRQAVGLHV